MPDWKEIIERRLGTLSAEPREQSEIVRELADHLEEIYEEKRKEGLGGLEARATALAELTEGRNLGKRIRRAKEESMNERIRQFWLPGLASLLAASVFLAVFARVTYMPHMLVVRSGAALLLYPAWLATQPIFGAIGAYFSRRAGGKRLTRIFAALSPSLALAALICVSIIVQIAMAGLGKPTDIGSMGAAGFARALFFAIVIPSAALLLGALPFLRTSGKIA